MAINQQSDIAFAEYFIVTICNLCPGIDHDTVKTVVRTLSKQGLIRTDRAAEHHVARLHGGSLNPTVGSDVVLTTGKTIEVKTSTARCHSKGKQYGARIPLSSVKEQADTIVVYVYNPALNKITTHTYDKGSSSLYASSGKYEGNFKKSLEIKCERNTENEQLESLLEEIRDDHDFLSEFELLL